MVVYLPPIIEKLLPEKAPEESEGRAGSIPTSIHSPPAIR